MLIQTIMLCDVIQTNTQEALRHSAICSCIVTVEGVSELGKKIHSIYNCFFYNFSSDPVFFRTRISYLPPRKEKTATPPQSPLDSTRIVASMSIVDANQCIMSAEDCQSCEHDLLNLYDSLAEDQKNLSTATIVLSCDIEFQTNKRFETCIRHKANKANVSHRNEKQTRNWEVKMCTYSPIECMPDQSRPGQSHSRSCVTMRQNQDRGPKKKGRKKNKKKG